MYLAFFYRCATAGTLTVDFEHVDKTGFADFNSLHVEEELAITDGYKQYTCSGLWNGTGDFKLSFTGDIYLYMLILSTDKVESLAHKYKTLFEQSERLVKISAAVFDKDENALQETGLMVQPEGTGIYVKDANGKLALIGVGVEETDAEGNAKTVIKLTADNIKLEGLVTANGYFKVKEDGSIEATSGQFKGEIEAISGKIGNGDNAFVINESGLSYGDISSWELDNKHKMLFTPELLRIQNQDPELSESFHRVAFGNNADPSVEDKFGTVAFVHRYDRQSNYWKAFNPAMRIYSMTKYGNGVALQTNGAIIAHNGPIAEKGSVLKTVDSLITLNKLSAMEGSVFIVKNDIENAIVYLPEYSDIQYMFKDTKGSDNNLYSVKVISHKDNQNFKVRVGLGDNSDTKMYSRLSEITEFNVYNGDIMEFCLIKIGSEKYWQAITHNSYYHN